MTNMQVVGTKNTEIVDPNVLNRKKPHTLLKSEEQSIYVQGNKLFLLNGNLLADSETSKKDIWKLQQTSVGKDAVESAGLAVQLSEVQDEETDQKTFVCETCEQAFITARALGTHKKLHKDPTSKRG